MVSQPQNRRVSRELAQCSALMAQFICGPWTMHRALGSALCLCHCDPRAEWKGQLMWTTQFIMFVQIDSDHAPRSHNQCLMQLLTCGRASVAQIQITHWTVCTFSCFHSVWTCCEPTQCAFDQCWFLLTEMIWTSLTKIACSVDQMMCVVWTLIALISSFGQHIHGLVRAQWSFLALFHFWFVVFMVACWMDATPMNFQAHMLVTFHSCHQDRMQTSPKCQMTHIGFIASPEQPIFAPEEFPPNGTPWAHLRTIIR